MKFEQSFLDDIKSRVPISQLIGARVTFDRKKTNASKGDYWFCCFAHGEKSPSAHCEDRKGRYFCFGCCISGDHFKFLMEMDGLEFPQAVERIADMAGVPMPGRRAMTPAEKADADRRAGELAAARAVQDEQRRIEDDKAREKRIKTVKEIWQETKDFKNSLGQAYLEWRCQGLSKHVDTEVVRFHPALEHPDMPGEHAAIVLRLQDHEGRGVAIWRIWLAKDGRGKLKVPEGKAAKMALGPSAGAACRLGGIAKKIGGGEGFETCLALRELGVTYPVWPMLSTSGTIGFKFPAGIDQFIYYPDPDGDKVKFKRRHDGSEFISKPPGSEAAKTFVANNPDRDIRISEMAHQADALEMLQKLRGVPIR